MKVASTVIALLVATTGINAFAFTSASDGDSSAAVTSSPGTSAVGVGGNDSGGGAASVSSGEASVSASARGQIIRDAQAELVVIATQGAIDTALLGPKAATALAIVLSEQAAAGHTVSVQSAVEYILSY